MALHGFRRCPSGWRWPAWSRPGGSTCRQPAIPAAIAARLARCVTVLENKYYMDWFNEHVLAAGARCWAPGLWKGGDQA
jgi:NADH-quinone oxidoreductase subunit L